MYVQYFLALPEKPISLRDYILFQPLQGANRRSSLLAKDPPAILYILKSLISSLSI